MTENADAQSLLGKAVSGQHIGRIEEVRIAGAHGTKITITPLGGGNTAKASPASTKEQPAPKAVALDDKTVTTKSVDPRAVAKESQEQKGQPSRTELASQLLNRVINVELKDAERMEAAQALQALKKRSKVGYGVLGLNMDHIQTLGLVLAGKAPQKPEAPKAPTKLALKQPEVVIPPKSEAKPQTRQEKAAYLLSTMVTGKAIHARLNAARDLVALKKSSKVSWNALGIDNNKDVEAILDLASKPIPAEPKVTNGQAAVTHLKTAAPKPAPKAPEKKPTAVAQPAKKPPAPVVASKPVHGGPTQDGPRQVEAKRLHLIMTDTRSGSLKVRQDHARQLLAHKKKTKVSWVALGLPQDMSKIIDDLLSQK